MLPFIEQVDQFLFHIINIKGQNIVFDTLLPFFRTPQTWIPLYAFLLFYIVRKYKKLAIKILFLVILCASLSDSISSHIIKPMFHRVRPCKELVLQGEVHNIVPCGSGYSFTSSHAANHFALATAFSLFVFFKRKKIQTAFFIWAFAVAYSQVYVGVHYPFDVFCGALLGIFLSYTVFYFVKKYDFLADKSA